MKSYTDEMDRWMDVLYWSLFGKWLYHNSRSRSFHKEKREFVLLTNSHYNTSHQKGTTQFCFSINWLNTSITITIQPDLCWTGSSTFDLKHIKVLPVSLVCDTGLSWHCFHTDLNGPLFTWREKHSACGACSSGQCSEHFAHSNFSRIH